MSYQGHPSRNGHRKDGTVHRLIKRHLIGTAEKYESGWFCGDDGPYATAAAALDAVEARPTLDDLLPRPSPLD